MTHETYHFFSPDFIYFATIAGAVAFNAVSVGIGQGLTGRAALEAVNEQPSAYQSIIRTALFGIALIETAAVIGSVVAFILLLSASDGVLPTFFPSIASLGIACAACLPGFVLGIVSSLPAQAACMAVARQPFLEQKIARFMLVMLSLLQTPVIFGLIIALILKSQLLAIETLRDALRVIASGICVGVGSIGPSLGLAFFMQKALQSLGRFKDSYQALASFIFISQAIIETPAIFTLIGSLLLLLVIPSVGSQENIVEGVRFICASLILGLGTIGAGLGSGGVAARVCEQISYNPDKAPALARLGMFAQGIIETSVIYAFLLFLVLTFFK
jgi:F0F1-type ATP synthase membrane subunit c/vacuolar-type H+-ATPase subunit K